ncbi:MAG TPA: hypothetical protein VE136_13330 [Anaerolineales bacterium]|nr:hypothetical protein [Anaerolineales bacterium]
MSKTLKIALIVTGSVVAGSILLLAGIIIGRSTLAIAGFYPGSMMYGYLPGNPNAQPGLARSPYRHLNGVMGPGMMGGFSGSGLASDEPLSISQAQQAVQDYLANLENQDLELGEVMIFDNHAYAQILEKNTGIGAMEVLVDPQTLAVYPEHGPNMMWNLKYGMMSAWGGYGPGMMGMMGGYGFPNWSQEQTQDVSADMPVKPEQAIDSAQDYLDQVLPGTQAEEHADPFYGYYTLHILRDGKLIGMLSVNGYTQQVFLHTWHGDFIEMSGE